MVQLDARPTGYQEVVDPLGQQHSFMEIVHEMFFLRYFSPLR